MKYINLLFILTFFTISNLSGQIIFNASAGEDICGDVTLTLNNVTDLTEDNCQFTTDYSNVQSGTNTLEVTSDIPSLFYTSTLDMVILMKNMDEGFESYAQGIAADFNNDAVISTDDLIAMRRVILGIDSDIPKKVKLATIDQVLDPLTSLDLSSEHTSLTFDDTDVEEGLAEELVLVIVGNLK